MSERSERHAVGAKIENLMLANHAEAQNGMLYVSGGCWTNHWRPPPSGEQKTPSHVGIALSVLIPWTETNRRQHLVLAIEPEDGGNPVMKAEADFEVGRPPGSPPGSDQRAVFAANADLVFERAGGYCLRAELGTGDVRAVSFQVFDAPLLQTP